MSRNKDSDDTEKHGSEKEDSVNVEKAAKGGFVYWLFEKLKEDN